MFFVGFELLLIELLTFHPSRVFLELAEVGILMLVGLGGVMRHLRKLRLLFSHIRPLKFLDNFLLFFLVLGKHHQKILDILSPIEPTANLLLNKPCIHPKKLIAQSVNQQLLDDLLILQINLLNLRNAGIIIIRNPLLELLLLLLHLILITPQPTYVLI